MSHPTSLDRVIRAMTDDGSFRVLVAETTNTVRAILDAQHVDERSLDEMAAVVNTAVLVRETMAPGHRVQAIYSDARGSQLVGDAFPEGKTRGLARIADPTLGIEVGDGGVLQIERVHRGRMGHRGFIHTEDGEDLTDALRNYFLRSEQVISMVDLATVVRDGTLVASAGYVVQLLPELTDPPLVAMQERLERFGILRDRIADRGADAVRILDDLLRDVERTTVGESPVMFHCPCDRNRVRGAAAALGTEEIRTLLIEEKDLTVTCDYCREAYVLGVQDYRSILDSELA